MSEVTRAAREPEVSVFSKWPVSDDGPSPATRPWAILHKADAFNGRPTNDFKTHAEAMEFACDLIAEIAGVTK